MASVSPSSIQDPAVDPWKKSVHLAQAKAGTSLRKAARKVWKDFLVFPDDVVYQCWSVVVVGLLIYSILITPYRIAFVDVDTATWMIIDTAVDFAFFLDLLVHCVLVYQDEERNIVTSHKAIFIHYLRTWFFIDLVSCVPLQLILNTQFKVNNLVKIARFSRFYKIARAFRVIRMFKFMKNRHQVIRYVNQVFLISLGVERLFWFMVTLIVMLHLVTCGWVFIGRFNIDTDCVNWITAGGYTDLNNTDLYIVSLYWAVTTVATVGYGDIHAYNRDEMIVNCMVMLLGVCIYSYMIGALTNLINSLDSRKAKLNQKLELLRQIGKDYGLSSNFLDKLASAVEYEHKNTNKEIDELIATLPTSLKNQLLVTIYQKKIESNAFFEGKSEHFVGWIAPYLRPYRFDEDEIVYRENDLANEMYFIVRGEVEFVLDKENTYVCYVSVSPNYYFGEIDLLFSSNNLRLHTTRTSARTELLALARDHFEAMMKTFESEAFEILSLSRDRRDRIDQRRRMAELEFQAKKEVSRHYSVPLKLADRKQRAENLKQEMAEDAMCERSSIADEDPETTDRRQPPAEVDSIRPKLFRTNTFGDTEYTHFTEKLCKSKGWYGLQKKHSTVKSDGDKEVLKRVKELQDGLAAVTKMMRELAEGRFRRQGRIRDEQIAEADDEMEESQEISDPENSLTASRKSQESP